MFVGECKENPSLRKAGSCYYAMTNSPSESCLEPFWKPIMPHFSAALAREGVGPTDKACFPGAGIFGFDGGLSSSGKKPDNRFSVGLRRACRCWR
jgi:hypothetical protein